MFFCHHEFYLDRPITRTQQLHSACATGLDEIANNLSIGDDRGLISSNIPTPASLGSNHLQKLRLME